MAIGMRQKKRPFGASVQMPTTTPGIGDGDPRMAQNMPVGLGMRDAPQEQKMGLGSRLFGRGWEDKAFALGGILQGDPSGVYMMRQQDQRERDAQTAAQQAQMQRAQELADWRWKEDYKRENKVNEPDTFERALMGAGIDPNSEEGQQLYRERAASMAGGRDEFVVVPIPGVGTYAGPRSGLKDAMGGGQAPQAPVGKLTPMGGPTQPASGGFRR